MNLTLLEEKIRYSFRDPSLLRIALTHSSYINEHGLDKTDCYERLEFLGDAVLEMVSSEYLFKQFPDEMEGSLSRKRSRLVCEEGLAPAARELMLGEFLFLGKGAEREGTRETDSVLADVFEALIAAIFLDGGFQEAKQLIYDHVLNDIDEKLVDSDAKSQLQELVQKDGKHVTYRLIEESGPDHNKHFVMECLIDDKSMEQGEGKSKKSAEQDAARRTMLKLKERN